MPQKGLVTSRVVVERNFAILPPEGVPESVLPDWMGTAARVLCSPEMGARFAQYQLDIQTGGGCIQSLPEGIEGFFYAMDGECGMTINGKGHVLKRGGFAFLSPGSSYQVKAARDTRLLWLKKRYTAWGGTRPGDVVGNENDIAGEPFMGVEELLLKKLLPDDVAYDMAMNIFTFPPGYSLPYTEVHVMEHGLAMLEGQGVYYLGDRWREVQAGDFIWMGPWCPQSFYATSSHAARYIYYKNVNRDVEL